MQHGDEALSNTNLACLGILVKLFITPEPHKYFDNNYAVWFILL